MIFSNNLIAPTSGPNLPQIAPAPTGQPTSIWGQIGTAAVDIASDFVRQKLIGSETPSSQPQVPSAMAQSTPGISQSGCPGIMSVRDPITGNCINLDALPPGGNPAVTGPYSSSGYADGYGEAVKGMYGVGLVPRVKVTATRKCPRGMALGDDGVCYDKRRLRKSDRMWDPGTKPLLTGGDRRAIAKAAAAGRKLDRAKKSLKRAGRALEKAC